MTMIESMEPRTLLSASPLIIGQDLTSLENAGLKAKADLTAALSTAKADVKAIKADVLAASPTTTQKKIFNKLQTQEPLAAAKYKTQVVKFLAPGKLDGLHLARALVNLTLDPGSTTVQAKALKDLTALENAFSSTTVSKIESVAAQVVSKIDADLNALATAVPAAQSDISTAESHLQNDLTTLSTDLGALQTDLATLASDLAL